MRPAKIFSLIVLPPLGQYVVTLEEAEGTRLIPIWIGPSEGTAIALKLNDEKTPRPMTHDLLNNILSSLNVKIEKIIITDIKNGAYHANIELSQDDKAYTIDARPSDSLALAVRSNAPVFIEDRVFEKSPVIEKPISEKEIKAFKEKMSNLKPDDFFEGRK
jgi:hypothetical protein